MSSVLKSNDLSRWEMMVQSGAIGMSVFGLPQVLEAERRWQSMKLCCVFVLVLAASVGAVAGDEAAARFSGINPQAGEPAVVLVGPGLDPAPVLYEKNADPQERQAAQQLADYLSRISGLTFAAAAAAEPLPDRAVLVGWSGQPLPTGLSREGFVIRTDGGRLFVGGGSPRATLYAVFALLEEQLGCRWWSYNEEDVPRRKTIDVAAQDTHIEPAFRIHDLFNREGQTTVGFFAYKRRGASGTKFTSVHNLCPMLKPHAKQHPGFLPMNKDGQRAFNNIHMNYTAPGMAEIVARELGREVARRKGNTQEFLYFAGMGDWYGGMDLSPESKRVYDEEAWTDPDGRTKPGYCATMLRMVNRAAEILERQHPGAVVATHAYMSLEAPPARTRPRSNVVVEIPRLRHDTVRSVEESQANQSFRRNLDRWCKLAPGRIYIWEYGANFNNMIKPFPCLRSLAANIKYYHKVGVGGVRIQGNYVSYGGDLAVLKNYVWGKLLWDPTRDVDELIGEFCEGYYGPAATEIIAYVNLLENSVRGTTPVKADEFDARFEKWLRPEIVQQAETLFARALAKTKGEDSDPYHRRVKEAQAGLEAFHLWRPAKFREAGEKLIRVDFATDTLPRARELIKYCRRASPREWGEGRSYRMALLTLHGGPLPTLRSGPVTVKVAPLQGGQLRSVSLGKTIAIDESRDVPNPGAIYYELIGRTAQRVDMQAELGVIGWGPDTKQIGYRTVELTDRGVVRTTGSLKLVAGKRQNVNTPSVQTVFHCGDHPEQIVVEYRNDAGEWITAAVNSKTRQAKIPRAAQLRITRRDRHVVIHDTYQTEELPTAVVEYLPAQNNQVAQVRVTVALHAMKLNPEKPTEYLQREIRVTPLTNP